VSLDTATTSGADAVIHAVLTGHHQIADIMAVTGLDRVRVHHLLGELTVSGRVHRAGYGVYQAGSIDVLRTSVAGHARLDPAGLLTVGIHADGTTAGWPLRDGAGRARHTTVVGGAVAGKTVLLRSILLAARTAGVDAQVIDIYDAVLREVGYPTATSMTAARAVFAAEHDLILARQHATTPPPLRLLVINDLHLCEPHALDLLAPLAERAADAAVAIVAGTRQALHAFGATGTGQRVRAALTGETVLLRTQRRLTTALAGATCLPALPDCLPGVGYLPHRSVVPFRAWLPGPATPQPPR
jgi:hypothetical protein